MLVVGISGARLDCMECQLDSKLPAGNFIPDIWVLSSQACCGYGYPWIYYIHTNDTSFVSLCTTSTSDQNQNTCQTVCPQFLQLVADTGKQRSTKTTG